VTAKTRIYWKAGRPYLDGNRVYDHTQTSRPRLWQFVAGKFDMTFLYSLEVAAAQGTLKSQMPQAICDVGAARPSAAA